MPYSLVIDFVPRSPLSQNHLNGRHLHSLFLDLVSSVDRELGNQLHQQQDNKAFTLSPLQLRPTRKLMQWSYRQAIGVGTPCWWRITLLDEELFGKLAYLWLNLNQDQAWQLGGSPLSLARVLSYPKPNQPWPNYCSYEQLYEEAWDGTDPDHSQGARKLNFEFCTPTAFRVSKFDSSLPDRDLVFRSLLKKWNRYSKNPFSESIIDFVYPTFFNIKTEIVRDRRSKFIGCVGDMTFSILGDADPQTIKQLNALTRFAFFAGIGRKTTMGMGQVNSYQLSVIGGG
jgi:CRISPR-associated endoribonuclease Cas6